MKTPSYLVATLVAITAALVWMDRRQVAFYQEMAHLEHALFEEANEKPLVTSPQSYKDLPICVQRYLERALAPLDVSRVNHDHIPSIRRLKMHQTGLFLLKDQWYPFQAHQTVATHDPGFVWHMALSFLKIGSLLPVRVCDALVQGRGILRASLGGFLTLAQLEDDTTTQDSDGNVLQGELSRWLAEAPLYPTVLLPHEGLVTWKTVVDGQEQQALLTMEYGNTKVELVVTFDANEHWMTTVQGLRTRTQDDGTFSQEPWMGRFSNYQPHGGIWVPTHMEAAWILDGQEQVYFQGDNIEFEYEWKSASSTAQE